MSLRVLASGSAGNCTLVVLRGGDRQRSFLIDLGLSPRRTRALLEDSGVTLESVDAVLLTHLDHDHLHAGWARGFPRGPTLHIHRHHLRRAERAGILAYRTEPFREGEAFSICGTGAAGSAVLASHDELGAAVFRIEYRGCSLGFATDIGRVTAPIEEHLGGVGVLAIESNYCPKMQMASGRSAHLKRRIMDGSGHLSNEQALHAVERIGPREHVVLLHLSRDCNTPGVAGALHAGADYALTIAEQDAPTRWIHAGVSAGETRLAPAQDGLFA